MLTNQQRFVNYVDDDGEDDDIDDNEYFRVIRDRNVFICAPNICAPNICAPNICAPNISNILIEIHIKARLPKCHAQNLSAHIQFVLA